LWLETLLQKQETAALLHKHMSLKSDEEQTGLYPHERGYVTPFITLSSISFVVARLKYWQSAIGNWK